MRYILNSGGYICNVSFGADISCDLGNCTEYTGEIPADYETIDEWHEEEYEKLNAWKIVEGNLVFDNAKYKELQDIWEKEEEENRVLHKNDLEEINEITKQSDTSLKKQYKTSSANGRIVELNDANTLSPNITINNVKCYEYNKIKLIATNKNILPNTATDKTINDVEFIQNEDRSIEIRGTATDEIEYDLAGASANTSPILVLKKDVNYYLSSNNQTIKMYNYDGTDREEVYSGNGGPITFSEDKKVTHITLNVSQQTELETTVFPQLEIGTSASEYVTHQEYDLEIDYAKYVEEGLFPSDDLFPNDDLFPKGTTIGYIKIENNKIYILNNNKKRKIGDGFLSVLSGFNYIYSTEDNYLDVLYYNNVFTDVERLSSKIEQTEAEINLEVSKKVGNDEIISKINQTAEAITIDANRININGTVSANGNFKVDTNGNAFLNGGSLNLEDSGTNVIQVHDSNDPTKRIYINESYLGVQLEGNNEIVSIGNINEDEGYIELTGNGRTVVRASGITTPILTQTSLESLKKNFEEVENATSIVKNSEIYKYNFKSEEDTDKKHYGFVIGENYNTPDEVISKSGEGIDTYSMCSILWKAVQEQQATIEALQKEINNLKGE